MRLFYAAVGTRNQAAMIRGLPSKETLWGVQPLAVRTIGKLLSNFVLEEDEEAPEIPASELVLEPRAWQHFQEHVAAFQGQFGAPEESQQMITEKDRFSLLVWVHEGEYS